MMKLISILVVTLLALTCTNAVQVWVTSLDKSKLLARQADLNPSNGNSNDYTKVTVGSNTFQEMYGFGGALTESAALNFIKMKSGNNQNYINTLRKLFDPSSGAGFQMIRVPMGSSDFSNTPYFTYDETVNDWYLDKWNWNRDSTYVIPVLKDILAINPGIKVLITPWTAPTWMKTSANASNAFYWGTLSDRYQDDFAYYFQITIQHFKAEGIPIYALTMQNEPQNEPNSYPVMRMSAQQQSSVAKLIGAKLKAANLNAKILVWDHNWDQPNYAITALSDSSANPFIAGSAWHCYGGSVSAQSQVHDAHPDKEIWFTECSGTGASNFAGNIPWNTNNLYIGAVQNWARTVLHWNLILDSNGGPKSPGGCDNCRGILTVHGDYAGVDFNEEYYGLAMFSKFLKLPAYRLQCNLAGGYNCVTNVCFKNADSSIVAVVANFCQTPQPIGLQNGGSHISTTVAVGLTTFVW